MATLDMKRSLFRVVRLMENRILTVPAATLYPREASEGAGNVWPTNPATAQTLDELTYPSRYGSAHRSEVLAATQCGKSALGAGIGAYLRDDV
jgi:hypothetical protein